MKSSSFVLLALLAFATASSGFDFNLKDCRVDHYDAWDVVTFPIAGGSGDYEYDFPWIPQHWYASKGRLYAPKGELRLNKYFKLKVTVFDRVSKGYLKKSLFFNFQSERIFNIFETDFDFDFDDRVKCQDFIHRRERGDQYLPISQTPTYTFPSNDQLENMIVKGDVPWIRATIDEAIESGHRCKVIAEFLSRFLALIQKHISIFKINAEQIKEDLFKLEEELKFLNVQLEDLESNSLNLERLRVQLQALKEDLSAAFNRRTGFQNEIKTIKIKINANQEKIFRISDNTIKDAQRNLQEEEDNIKRFNNKIQDLELQLRLVKKSRENSISKKGEYQSILAKAKQEVEVLVSINQELQSKITAIRLNDLKAVEKEIEGFQIKIEQIKRQIENIGSGREFEIQKIKTRISEIQVLIKNNTAQLARVQAIYFALQGSLEQFTLQINNQYYSCYNVIASHGESRQQGGQFVASAQSNAFFAYLKQVFGSVTNTNIRARFGGNIIDLKRVDIFSPSWIRVYGIPFSAGYGNNRDLVEEDFQCEEIQDLQVFSGRIQSINTNMINVKDKHGESYSVHLGGCTRLEAVTGRDIPEVGDQVYWKGRHRKDGSSRQFNGYHFTCY